jgi:signal transduction histidine kinase
MNVIANAVEAMEGGGTVSIYTRRCPQFVEIRISDEGIGIHEQDLTRIFDPFYTTRQKGSGLGLAISYKIIEAHSGEIEAESRPGEGTTFYIRLPTA